MASDEVTPTMLEVPERTKADGCSKAPTASIAAAASLQPTETGAPSERRKTAAASEVTAPRRSHAAASGGATSGANPTRPSTPAAGSDVNTWQRPLLDHGSESGEPVSRSPTESLGWRTKRVRATVSGSCLDSQRSLAGA